MLVVLAAVLITLAALPFASARPTTGRFLLSLALLALHLAATIAYYAYTQSNVSDARGYYFDPYNFSKQAFALGTVFTYKFTQFLRADLGGSYFGCFLFFQSIGFWGVIMLMRTFEEIALKIHAREQILPKLLLFLPSIHFWTSAIGKDAPMFFAISLCTWAVLELRKRIVFFGIAMLVMVLFRPHMALIAVTALAAAAFFHREIVFGRKVPLLAVTVVGGIFLAGTVQATLGVDVTDFSSLASFLDERNEIAGMIGGGSSIGDAPLTIRLLSLLFRPLFFDAQNIAGAVASFENIGSLLLFAYFAKNWFAVRHLAKRVFFVEFAMMFSIATIATLTAVYYNIGLGLRQRIMIFPPLLSVFVATWAFRQRQPAPVAAHAPGGLAMPGETYNALTGTVR